MRTNGVFDDMMGNDNTEKMRYEEGVPVSLEGEEGREVEWCLLLLVEMCAAVAGYCYEGRRGENDRGERENL